ncbi:carbohydrate esterase family 5 protein [Saccharata proteae CBS 121410]|uniref:Carbohydrate esterase family 5 protein n=1 Tax=Saccharata proteae CBS 121410 TaxID=1314787 RepID=A0A9P4I0D5_9PEZI|nr:carbohydrate esterase family 5 protein [Saccharata proteae CBS 121410]
MLALALIIPTLTLLVSALPALSPRRGTATTTCASIHIFLARGTTQSYPGEMITLAELVIANNDDADYEDVEYPATWNYATSTKKGYTAMVAQMTSYIDACPDAKVVLLGYSQGAHITGDAMCGGGGDGLGSATDPIDSSYMDHVSAVVWYGDPRNVINLSYDVGTDTTGNGSFPRTEAQLAVCATYADKIHSYCDTNDLFCASGVSAAVHEGYPDAYDDVAAEWVDSMLA